MRFVLTFALLLAAGSAEAASTVLCFGDSIMQGNNNAGVCAALARIRPDITGTNAGSAGDTSNSVGRLATLLDAANYNYVVILIGVNDWFFDISNAQTLRNFRRMAQLVVADGAVPIILTLTPVVCTVSGACGALVPSEQIQVAAINPMLTTRFGAGQYGVIFGDLNAAMAATWTTNSFDGLHPTNHGNLVVARYVSSLIP